MAELRIIVLGSTGSIGTQTLEVLSHLNAAHARGEWRDSYRVVGLAAGRNAGALAAQAGELSCRELALAAERVENGAGLPSGVRRGADAAERLVREVECDIVLGAMVGSAGLPATLAAVELGRDVALANKETLVAAGELVVPAAERTGSRLLPVDSEHSGVWQCLAGQSAGGDWEGWRPPVRVGEDVVRIVLTASGGPFRTWDRERVYRATPEEALKHPTWNMGPKVTIDCASLTNKALEVIEAHWLFGVPGSKIEVMVHPQSVVHAMVEFADGALIAQMGPPDMRNPIHNALTFPARTGSCSRRMDLRAMSRLDFEPPDLERFPALGLAYRVIESGGTSGAVFNAANEAAVEAFLGGHPGAPFGRIPELAAGAMKAVGVSALRSLADVLEADAEARRYVARAIG